MRARYPTSDGSTNYMRGNRPTSWHGRNFRCARKSAVCEEAKMSEFNDLVERYIAVWNEVDPDRRQRLIADTFSDGVSYVDPLMASEGHATIDAMVRAVQARFPGYRFRRAGVGDGHHDRIRFRWELATGG